MRREVTFTKGGVIVRGQLLSRGKSQRTDYILCYKANIPLAVIEAKDHCREGVFVRLPVIRGERHYLLPRIAVP